MKRFGLLFVCLLCSALTVAAQSRDLQRSAALNAGGNLRINTDVTQLRVIGWERNEVVFTARITANEGGDGSRKDPDYMRRVIEATEIELFGDNNALTLRTNFDKVPNEDGGRWNRQMPRIEMEVRVPHNLRLNLNTDRGNVELRGLTGQLVCEMDRGQLSGQDVSGDLRLQIDRGGNSQLANVNGQLDANIERSHFTFEGVTLKGDSQISAGRSTVIMRMPRTQGLNLDADRERRSEITTDLPITANTLDNNRIAGPINGGGPRLAVRTDRSRIQIKTQ